MSIFLNRDPQYITADEAVASLQAMIKERAAKLADYQKVIEMAMGQLEEIQAFSYCDDGICIDGSGCGISFPCCGVTSYELYVRDGCPDCWEFMPSRLACGKIQTSIPFAATGKLVVYGRNRYVPDQATVADSLLDASTGDYTIYLDGQPEIQPFGFIQICDNVFFYYCKSGKQWAADAGIDYPDHLYYGEDETEFLPEDPPHADPDFSTVAGYRPLGTHTALQVRANVRCGRLDTIDPVAILAGAVVKFPMAFDTRRHVNLLLYTAAEMLYIRLISSCSSPKDIERYTGMNDYYAKKAQAERLMIRPLKKKRLVNHNANDFRSSLSLRSRWPAYDYGLPTGRCGCGC